MILGEGDKILVVHRRLFEADKTRYFVGIVDAYADGIAKATGFTWMKDTITGGFAKKSDPRTKIFPLASGTIMTYELPRTLEIHNLKLGREANGQETLTDGETFNMNLAEKEDRF